MFIAFQLVTEPISTLYWQHFSRKDMAEIELQQAFVTEVMETMLKVSSWEWAFIYNVSQKNKQNYFCYNCVKLAPKLTIFGTKMANSLKLYEVHSFSTSPNSCHCTTMQSDHFSGKPGNVREFETCQAIVRDYVNSQGIVRENCPQTVHY